MKQLFQILVIFLDDAKKYPKWTNPETTFFIIPKELNFRNYPAYTYHVWLTEKSTSWSEYGSSAKIPVPERKKIREHTMQYKSFDGAIPEVTCSGKNIFLDQTAYPLF